MTIAVASLVMAVLSFAFSCWAAYFVWRTWRETEAERRETLGR